MFTMARQPRRPGRLPLSATLFSVLVLCFAAGCQRTTEETGSADHANDGEHGTATENIQATADSTTSRRLVSTNGSLTEIVYELGLGDALVGVDTSSTYPAETEQLPKVGYYRRLSAEGLVSLSPTHILVGPDAGPEEVLRQVGATDVEIVEIRKVTNTSDIGARIEELGEALGVSDAAATLTARVNSELNELKRQPPINGSPKGVFLYARGPDTLLIAGDNTVAQMMFELAGATNAVAGFTEFRPLTAEALVAAEPAFIAVPEDGMASIGGVEGMLRLPGVAQTPAGQNRAFVAVDDLRFLGGGPRTASAATEFRQAVTDILTERVAE